jgi:hypothetical protein
MVDGLTMDTADDTTTFLGLPVPDGTLVSAEWTRSDGGTAALEILNNGSVIRTVVSTAAGRISAGAIGDTVSAGLISFRNRGATGDNNTSNVQIVAVVEPD